MSGQGDFVAGPELITSDNTEAQEADIATLYNYATNNARVHTWLEDGAAFEYQGGLGWWREMGGQYPLANVGDRMVSGDFDGDRLEDVAAFRKTGSTGARIDVWLAYPENTDPDQRFAYQGAWWSVPDGYDLNKVGSRFVSGDFTGDGKDDIATMYDYSSGGSSYRIHVWRSTGSSFSYDPPGSGQLGWWRASPDFLQISMVAGRFVAGDFTSDGKADVAAFYDLGGTGALLRVWRSTGSSFVDMLNWWSVGNGYDLSKVGDRFVAGNFNGAGKDDVATFYDYSSGGSSYRIHVWLSTGSSFSYDPPGSGQLGWWRTDTGYSLSQVGNRMVSADFGSPSGGADGKADVATFYDYTGGAARIHVWLSTGSGLVYTPPPGHPNDPALGWWRVSGYWLGEVAGRMVAGPFDGR